MCDALIFFNKILYCSIFRKGVKKPKQLVAPVVVQPTLRPFINIAFNQPDGPPPPIQPIGQYSTPLYIPNVNDGRVLVQVNSSHFIMENYSSHLRCSRNAQDWFISVMVLITPVIC